MSRSLERFYTNKTQLGSTLTSASASVHPCAPLIALMRAQYALMCRRTSFRKFLPQYSIAFIYRWFTRGTTKHPYNGAFRCRLHCTLRANFEQTMYIETVTYLKFRQLIARRSNGKSNCILLENIAPMLCSAVPLRVH